MRSAAPLPVLEVNRLPVKHLRQAVDLLGPIRLQRALNVHRTTVERWLSGKIKIPGAQHLAIRALLGDLPGTDGQWPGWRFDAGELVSPEGTRFTAGEVRAIPLRIQALRALESEVMRLKILRAPATAGVLLERETCTS